MADRTVTIGELLKHSKPDVSVDEVIEPERSDMEETIKRNQALEDEFVMMDEQRAAEDEIAAQEARNMELARQTHPYMGALNQQLFPVPQVYPDIVTPVPPEAPPGPDEISGAMMDIEKEINALQARIDELVAEKERLAGQFSAVAGAGEVAGRAGPHAEMSAPSRQDM